MKEEEEQEEEEEARKKMARSLAAGLPRRTGLQTGLHLHNRYIPAAWTGVEAESSVSSVRYIARLVLARWQESGWRSLLERERKRKGGREGGTMEDAGRKRWKKTAVQQEEAAMLSPRCARSREEAHAVPEETDEKREKA